MDDPSQIKRTKKAEQSQETPKELPSLLNINDFDKGDEEDSLETIRKLRDEWELR